jgi:hypothetical protein
MREIAEDGQVDAELQRASWGDLVAEAEGRIAAVRSRREAA